MIQVKITKKDSNPVACGRAFVDGEFFDDWEDINPKMKVAEIKERLKSRPEIRIEEIKPKKSKEV